MDIVELNQKEQILVEWLKKIDQKIHEDNIQFRFQEFLDLEAAFSEEFKFFLPKYSPRYEWLAVQYLLKVIQKSRKPQMNSRTFISYSYFSIQSAKIRNTDLYPFEDSLIELNFFNFLKKLLKGIKPFQQEEDNPAINSDRYMQLIESNNLCEDQCIGCNTCYYQFYPIELNTRSRQYQAMFLGNSADPKSKKSLINTSRVDYNSYLKVDLLNLRNKESQLIILREMTKILNKKGGFILIGCKRIQQFHGIKNEYAYQQLLENYMDAYFVIGESLNQQQRNIIRSNMIQISSKITPKLEFGKNIQVSFIPVKKSSYMLGYGLQSLELNEAEFQRRQLYLTVILINPNQTNYDYWIGGQQQIVFEEFDQTEHVEQYKKSQKDEINRREYLQRMYQGVTNEQRELLEKFGPKTYRSYFDKHQCKAFQT